MTYCPTKILNYLILCIESETHRLKPSIQSVVQRIYVSESSQSDSIFNSQEILLTSWNKKKRIVL